MRIFETALPFIGKENEVYETLNQQYIVFDDQQEKSMPISNHLYRLVLRESNFFLIFPNSSVIDENIFTCEGNPFIEISLMNILELLISPKNIEQINNMKQLLTIYGLVIQNMTTLTRYDHYEIANLEKVNSLLCLAFCISILYSNDEALLVFKKVYKYKDSYIAFQTLDQIHNFMNYLKKAIYERKLITNDIIVQQALLKLENDLLRNWSIGHTDQYNDIIKFVYDNDLWRYSGKILTLVDRRLDLSLTVKENFGQIFENEENNLDLCLPDDSTQKLEILLSMRIYLQLILDENYQSRINTNNKQHLPNVLIQQLDYFKQNLNKLKYTQINDKLKLISLIPWIKYYIQYYVYALKNNIKHDVINKIHDILVTDTSAFCLTIKLYIIKQLCYSKNTTFYDICKEYADSNVIWIRSMIVRTPEPITNAQRVIILPTPLFECSEEFINMNEKLKSHPGVDEMKKLINECRDKRDTTYCFLIWFIHYYTRFYMNNVLPDDQFVRLIRDNVSQELNTCFEPIGYKFIYSLCNNFDENSYFHLNTFMSTEDVHQRLLVLNIIALLISFKFTNKSSTFSSLLFNEHFKMPENYTEHFDKLSYLFNIAFLNDPALIQMINIRTQINNQPESDMNIFRCSSNCSWLSVDQNQCPLCKREMKDTHIPMTKNETLVFITRYIQTHKQKDRLNTLENSDRHLTYHFLDFFMHAIFLFLHELDFMSYSKSVICTYFQEQIKTKYTSIRKRLSDTDQCYIWLYKLINHMMNKNFIIEDYVNIPEKLIEEKLIIPHINSVINEIKQYKLAYVNFVYGDNKQNQLISFVEELVEDNNKYPLLQFFNVTNIHSIDIIDAFHNKLRLLPDYEKSYPLTTFLLKHLSAYDNIQYLYPIIKFTNYLIQQFDHLIKRNDAKKKTISDYLQTDSFLKIIYDQFLDVWFQISLKEVQFNEQKYPFQHSHQKYNFEKNTNISMFLLNKSNDDQNMIVAACLQTFANLQNDFIDYFNSHIINNEDKDEKLFHRTIPIQSIQQKHILNFNTNKLRKLIVEKGFVFNYTYGMSKEIIYDYDEIEWTLRNEISCLPRIDIKNMRYFNYQFELYDENSSLINDIRQRFEQKLFDDIKRNEIKQVIDDLNNDSLLELSGSLEYILTYLRTVNNKNILETSTIQSFTDSCANQRVFIDKKTLTKKSFSTIHLKYLIDLYELIEETIFDKILSNNIRNDLCEQSFPPDQGTSIVNQFIDMISNTNCFKDLNCWIDMLKRLLVRLLLPKMNINFDSPLHDYVKRSDMWKGNVTRENIRTIEIKNNIRLKHAFIIIKGLEAKQEEKISTENPGSMINSNYEQQKPIQTARPAPQQMNPVQKNRRSDYR